MIHISVAAHPHVWALWHFARYCSYVISFCAIFSTFCLPCDDMLSHVPHVRRRYLAFITVVCFFAFKWRKREPSLALLDPPRMEWLNRLTMRYLGREEL